jgi:hypothetical protein
MNIKIKNKIEIFIKETEEINKQIKILILSIRKT